MSRDNFVKSWSLDIPSNIDMQAFISKLDKSSLIIMTNEKEVDRLEINKGITLTSIDGILGIKVDLNIDHLKSGKHSWTIEIINDGRLILSDSGTITVKGKASKEKVARPWDLLNPKTKYVPSEISEDRLNICKECDLFAMGVCRSCGCYMPIKTKLEHASCPLNKWSEYSV